MNKELALPNQKEISSKFATAKRVFEKILIAEGSLSRSREELLILGFRLGAILSELKEEIGHGKWLFWLGGTWPELGERNARRCIALYKDNEQLDPKSAGSADLNIDSVRKFMWGYIPEKERPTLPGDEPVSPAPHYLTFVNHFAKFRRQASLGRVELPPLPVIRRDFEPTILDMAEFLGRDWMRSLLV